MCILLGAGNWDFGSPHDEFQECSLGQIMVFFCDFMCYKGTSRSIVMAVLAILQGVQPLWCSQTYFAYFWLFWQEIHTYCQYSPEDIPSKLWNTVHHINMCPLPGCNKTYIPVRPQHPDWWTSFTCWVDASWIGSLHVRQIHVLLPECMGFHHTTGIAGV